jgi:hypothetical protein
MTAPRLAVTVASLFEWVLDRLQGDVATFHTLLNRNSQLVDT